MLREKMQVSACQWPLIVCVFIAFVCVGYFFVIVPLHHEVADRREVLSTIHQHYAKADELTQQIPVYQQHVFQLASRISRYQLIPGQGLAQAIAELLMEKQLTVVTLRIQGDVIRLQVRGAFVSLLQFIDALTSLPQLVQIQEVTVTSNVDGAEEDMQVLLVIDHVE
jgi:Tfp pilus assembly protein PilO